MSVHMCLLKRDYIFISFSVILSQDVIFRDVVLGLDKVLKL